MKLSGNKERPRPKKRTSKRSRERGRRGRGRRTRRVWNPSMKSFNFLFVVFGITCLIMYIGYGPISPFTDLLVGTEPLDERVTVTVLAMLVTNMSESPDVYVGVVELHNPSGENGGQLVDIAWQGTSDGVEFIVMNERPYEIWIYPFTNETYMIESIRPYADAEGYDSCQLWYILDEG